MNQERRYRCEFKLLVGGVVTKCTSIIHAAGVASAKTAILCRLDPKYKIVSEITVTKAREI